MLCSVLAPTRRSCRMPVQVMLEPVRTYVRGTISG
jgi:hypothetical protein